MAKKIYQSTIIDRLCGGNDGVSLASVRESVRMDLEELLNARQGRDDIPAYFQEVQNSLATYGLNSFNSMNLESHDERRRLLKSIKRAIELFEPRLENIEIVDLGIMHPFILRFQISAILRVGKYIDQIVFGTTIKKNGTAVVEN